ncbi:MAG: DUF6978 family protein [Terriglobia bacterium]
MSLSQAEADRLLQLPKIFLDPAPIEFTLTEPMDNERFLRSTDRREEFILTMERGNRNRLRLKYQTRARKVIILARLELNGARHKNPAESPYKPGQWLSGTHLHLYREGFEDRIAFQLQDATGWTGGVVTDGIPALEQFMRFCGVATWPSIQTAL